MKTGIKNDIYKLFIYTTKIINLRKKRVVSQLSYDYSFSNLISKNNISFCIILYSGNE